MKKNSVEIRDEHYGGSILLINGKKYGTINTFDVSDFISSISKKLFLDFADGCTIFSVTDKQLEKIKKQEIIKTT